MRRQAASAERLILRSLVVADRRKHSVSRGPPIARCFSLYCNQAGAQGIVARANASVGRSAPEPTDGQRPKRRRVSTSRRKDSIVIPTWPFRANTRHAARTVNRSGAVKPRFGPFAYSILRVTSGDRFKGAQAIAPALSRLFDDLG
jgi:hypothetical protein